MYRTAIIALVGAASALPTASLDKRTNNFVALEAVTINSGVTSAPCSLGSPSVCIGRSSLALVQYFFNGYQATVDTLKRSDLEEGVWHSVGNSSMVDGIEIQYQRRGEIQGIRTVERDSLDKRASKDHSAQGGFVGDFYWHAPNQQAYNSFHSTASQVQNVANILTNYVLKYKSIENCLDFGDDDGILNSGVVTFGWNGQAFKYSSQAALATRLNRDCQYGQILHDNLNNSVQQNNI